MANPLLRLVEIAQQEIGTREGAQNNTGPQIAEYQSATWLTPAPWPWCAAFTSWVLREWLEEADSLAAMNFPNFQVAEKWRCKDASAFGWEKWARQKGLDVLTENDLAKAGDFVVFDFSHIGIVAKDQANPKDPIETIEGNTNGAGDRDSTTGDGVWSKKRAPSLVKCYIRLVTQPK
ncbi:MAG: CHAP domain-containing protein [Fibrobacterota bacterium]